LILDQGFEVTEPREHFILLFQEAYPSFARIVICKRFLHILAKSTSLTYSSIFFL